MKTNEAPKSRFVYPDKLYARCKDNKTLDMSYAPQNMEAVEYIRTDAFIERAVKWLKEAITNTPECNRIISQKGVITMGLLIEDFKKYMEGE